MKDFLKILKRFASPYKKYLAWAVLLNIFSAVFNIFSFTLIIPILQILFGLDTTVYEFMAWNSDVPIKDLVVNNMYYYVTWAIATWGPSRTLLLLGLFMMAMTALKTSCYFGSSAIMVPIRTGIVRDIRTQVYNKLLSLPMGFFSQQKKGDIIARMSGDVNEIEHSITSSLDMLIKNPILIFFYFTTLIVTSWQLTLFTISVVPLMAWGMSAIGKKLKRKSLEAQEKWSETMSQLDETLGGLRVIKAFIAEDKMKERFANTANEFKTASSKVATRQASAHPVSEFLGTCMIMIVLWFGGTLILSDSSPIDAPTFIFYMVILYSVLNPLKDFSFAQTGASVGERINPFYKVKIMHNGLDLIAPAGDPVPAAGDGVVTEVTKSRKGLGNVVTITHKGGYKTRYAHLADIEVRKGNRVRKGKVIGYVGVSGNSFAPHLHYEVYRDTSIMDPVHYMFESVTPDEYVNMLVMSASTGQSMD